VVPEPAGLWVPVASVCAGVWLAYRALVTSTDSTNAAVLRLWGLTWTRDEACCHFLITGVTGTGKTARAVVPIVHGLRSTIPDTGILAVDSKGALWQPLSQMAHALGQEDTLRLIRVRPTHVAPSSWVPPLRLNLLADASIPWSTYAKLVVDTATAAGQRGGQAFFKETARDVITHAMHALELADQLNARFSGANPKIEAKSLMAFALARHECADICAQFDLALRLVQGASEPPFNPVLK
jgi:hypothetical protein